jgi:hypothetical protein
MSSVLVACWRVSGAGLIGLALWTAFPGLPAFWFRGRADRAHDRQPSRQPSMIQDTSSLVVTARESELLGLLMSVTLAAGSGVGLLVG